MDNSSEKTGKIKRILGDSIWSIAGLVLMNVVAQFGIYPLWNKQLGNELYGRILYLISGMNIFAVSFGIACNYARMKSSIESPTFNRTYLKLLAVASLVAVPYILVYAGFSGSGEFFNGETALLILLTIVTMWRYYADVEYRLSLDYRQFFIYYLVISVGYGIGALLFLATGLWPLTLLVGEVFGLLLVWFKGHVLRPESRNMVTEDRRLIVRLVMILFLTELISNLIFNGDRVLLNLMIDGVAVTIYYQASLLGKTMSLITTPLNSVLIGYLARSKIELSMKLMNLVTLLTVGIFVVLSFACSLASHVLIRLLYPQNYDLVKGFFLIANAAQVAYFLANVLLTLLLRFCKTRYQLYVNLVYAGLFVGLCIPATVKWGLNGFCSALLVVCILRVCFIIFLGYRSIMQRRNSDETERTTGSLV